MFKIRKKKGEDPLEESEVKTPDITETEDNRDADSEETSTESPQDEEPGDTSEDAVEKPLEALPLPIAFNLGEKLDDWLDSKQPADHLREAMKSTVEMIQNAVNEGAVDESLFDILMKGVDYDRAVTAAAEAGELKGRNARIEELMAEEDESDGVPHPGTGSGRLGNRRVPSIFELARNA